jgi:hypothetical protein
LKPPIVPSPLTGGGGNIAMNASGIPGLSINGFTNSSNSGIVFSTLKPFEERRDPGLSLVAEAGAVLDLELEAADRAEPVDRRRREHRDERPRPPRRRNSPACSPASR